MRVVGRLLGRICVVVLATCGGIAEAQGGSEFMVVLGAGNAGSWQTEIRIANTSSSPATVVVSRTPLDVCPPIIPCDLFASLAGNGSGVTGAPNEGVAAVYVGNLDNPAVPVVAARAYSAEGQSVDLPVLRVTAVMQSHADVLVFAGAQRQGGSRSNLSLVNVEDPHLSNGTAVQVKIELFGTDGAVAGSTEVSLPTRTFYFVSDVVAALGVSELSVGQIRVSRVSGDGVFAGVMTTVRSDGTASSTVGTAPAP